MFPVRLKAQKDTERTATPAQIKTIYRFKTDQVNVPDDFDASPDW